MTITRSAQHEHLRAFYEPRLARHGLAPAALDWGSSASQERRFAVLLEVGIADGESLLDVGCGLADLRVFLAARGLGGVRYAGIDVVPALIERARRRFPDADPGSLAVRDLRDGPPGAYDVVVASGTFNVAVPGWARYFVTSLRAMWRAARRACAFNLISARAPFRHEGIVFAEPEVVLAACRRLTPRVELRHDYLPHDFTVYLRRE